MRRHTLTILVAFTLTACAHDKGANPTAHTPSPRPHHTPASAESHPLTFTDPANRTYDALLTVPDAERWNHAAVLLIGGGTVTDMHWTIPGSVEYQGQSIPLTISGQPTRDADTLAAALIGAGFAVMQYSSIHQGDLDAIDSPALADYVPYGASRDIAAAALATLRAQPDIEPNNVVLLGHSLGGTRALQLAATDPGIRALVLLAPAYSSRLGVVPSLAGEEAIEALKKEGLDADAGIPRHVFNAKRQLLPPPLNHADFDQLDRDDDEVLRRWEIASALVLAHLDAGDVSDLTAAPDFNGAPFPADVLTVAFGRDIPTLAIFAGDDPISVHEPLLGRTPTAPRAAPESLLTVEILPRVGHNLGPVVPRDNPELIPIAGPILTGPMDPQVPPMIARWLSDIIMPAAQEH